MRRLLMLAALLVSGCATYEEPYPAYGHGYPVYTAPAYVYSPPVYTSPTYLYRPRVYAPPPPRVVTPPPPRRDWHRRDDRDERRWRGERRSDGERGWQRGERRGQPNRPFRYDNQ